MFNIHLVDFCKSITRSTVQVVRNNPGKVALTSVGFVAGIATGGVGIAALGTAIGIPTAGTATAAGAAGYAVGNEIDKGIRK